MSYSDVISVYVYFLNRVSPISVSTIRLQLRLQRRVNFALVYRIARPNRPYCLL